MKPIGNLTGIALIWLQWINLDFEVIAFNVSSLSIMFAVGFCRCHLVDKGSFFPVQEFSVLINVQFYQLLDNHMPFFLYSANVVTHIDCCKLLVISFFKC